MKILILGFTKISYMPYMNFYTEQFASTNNEIHLFYWNRDEKEDVAPPIDMKLHEFRLYQEDEIAKIKKIKSFMKYRKKAKQLLLKEKFDFVIVLHTIPGVILYDVLKKNYSNKYILDYRDFTFENIGFYKSIIHKLVNHSTATFVSSDAFRKYLPETSKIYTSHNILLDSLKKREVRRCKTREASPIRIRYWGFIRHEKINKIIIDRLANDNRFELHYHGREQQTANNLKQYCAQQCIGNVFFHGAYFPEDRYVFAEKTDLLHNIYENDIPTSNAMGNKFYDGITFYLPQICNKESFMGDQVSKLEIGLEINPYNEDFSNKLYDYYNSINWVCFEEKCDNALRMVLAQYSEGTELIANL